MMKTLLCTLCIVAISYALPVKIYAATPSLQFLPVSHTVPPQSKMKVDIVVDTDGVAVGGVGAKLSFDTQYLTIDEIIPGKMFADYPLASYSNEKGTANIAGIASDKNTLYKGSGVFAMVIFSVIKEGKTEVKFLYQPGSTTDSNIAVMYGTGDALEKVNHLLVTIAKTAPKHPINTKKIEENRFISQAPIKTDPNQKQSKVEGQVLSENTKVSIPTATPTKKPNQNKILGYGMMSAGVLILLGVVAFLF